MQSRTERYLNLARQGRNQWWRYALGVVTIAFFWLVLGYLPYPLIASFEPFGSISDYIGVNFAIFMMLAGVAVAVRLIHRRPLMTLVTPEREINWRRAGEGAAVWCIMALAIVVIEALLHPGRYYISFDAYRFFPFALVVLIFTPIQSATEELLFRGYVMQGLGVLVKNPVAIAVSSSVVFTAPHMFNPEVQAHGALIMAANYFALGLLLATITLRDGKLELAIGVHTGNNLFLALFANYDGSPLKTESVFTARALDPVYSLVTLVVAAVMFYWWIFRRTAGRDTSAAS